jgi:hypothetical protein
MSDAAQHGGPLRQSPFFSSGSQLHLGYVAANE